MGFAPLRLPMINGLLILTISVPLPEICRTRIWKHFRKSSRNIFKLPALTDVWNSNSTIRCLITLYGLRYYTPIGYNYFGLIILCALIDKRLTRFPIVYF